MLALAPRWDHQYHLNEEFVHEIEECPTWLAAERLERPVLAAAYLLFESVSSMHHQIAIVVIA
jgi:hypothetical protein